MLLVRSVGVSGGRNTFCAAACPSKSVTGWSREVSSAELRRSRWASTTHFATKPSASKFESQATFKVYSNIFPSPSQLAKSLPSHSPRLWPSRVFSSQSQSEPKDKPKKQVPILKRIARALGVAVWFVRTVIWLAFLLLLALIISWTIYTNVPDWQKRTILSHFIPQIIPSVVKYADNVFIERVLLRAVAFLTEDANLAEDLCQRQALAVMLQLSRAGDVRMNYHIARALSNIAVIESLQEFVLNAGLCEALKELEAAARDSDSPFNKTVVEKTYVALGRTISALSAQPEYLERILDEVEFDVLKRVYAVSQPDDYTASLTDALADLCNNNEQAAKLVRQGGLAVFESIVQANLDDVVGVNIARCLANCAADDQLAFSVAREGGLDILQSLVTYPLHTAAMDHQILRTLANLARDDQNKQLILRGEWLDYVKQCCRRDVDAEVGFACVVTLANLAADAEAATRIMEKFQLRDVAHLFTVQHQMATRPHFARLLANLTKNERLVLRVYELMGDDVLERLTTGTNERMTLLSVARALANFAANAKTALEVAQSPLLRPLIIDLARSKDKDIVHQMVRTIANLAANAGSEIDGIPGLKPLLREWALNNNDEYIRANAIRAEASLASIELKGGKFAEGIYLLYPLPPSSATNSAASSTTGASSSSSSSAIPSTKSFQPDFDVVFIHGVGGDPYSTWAGGNESVCWPRDWLPRLFPKARVISVGYGIFLSRWSGKTLPLEEQAKIIQQRLKLAQVGSRPVVFVTHSFGGLILKQVLRNASVQTDYQSILDSTKGVVFYSVPHMGSDLTTYTNSLIADTLFQSSSAITELKPNSDFLKKLNEDFRSFAPHVSTLSFGENDKTCYVTESTMSCWQVVSDDSANPGFQGPQHHFVKLDHNHREVCKPRDRNDPRFVLVAKFIRDAAAQLQQEQQQEQQKQQQTDIATASMADAATAYFRSMYKWNSKEK